MGDKLDLSNPEDFLSELENCLTWFMEIMGNVDKSEFEPRQKSQIAGMFLGITRQIDKMSNKLRQWGYLP